MRKNMVELEGAIGDNIMLSRKDAICMPDN
jgi:hypothetical protein